MSNYEKLLAGLNTCAGRGNPCAGCSYHCGTAKCVKDLIGDAADVIERLIKERDAAVKDLHESETYLCDYCEHQGDKKYCERGCRWGWRGLQEGQNERN